MRRSLYMLVLIVAGEAIFALPFHLTRFFRPTVLEVFNLTATELGAAQGVYGILAMLAYFPGGPIADRFSARKLMALSLWTTAAGGLYMASFPGYRGSLLLWGFFGITTILLFWAAMIRACRDWGGNLSQGRAYGLLDGGRGALSAILATLGVLLFSLSFPEGYDTASFEQKSEVLRTIVFGYCIVTALAGLLVWLFIADELPGSAPAAKRWNPSEQSLATHIYQVIRIPAVWLQAVIVFCAYVGYKGFDNYALFAVQGHGIDEIEAARMVTIASWLRPVAAIGLGLVGDRFNASRTILWLFGALLASHLYFALAAPVPGAAWLVTMNTLLTAVAIFGFRGLYFALFEEAKVPAAATGTAVGFVSVIGFTPDIFVTYAAGVLIDRSPGLAGHQHFFMFLAVFSVVGLVASYALTRLLHKGTAGGLQSS